MAIDQVEKRRRIATQLAEHSARLMQELEALESLDAECTDSGVTFGATDFTGVSGLTHLDPASVDAVRTSTRALRAFMRDNFHDDNFQKARR